MLAVEKDPSRDLVKPIAPSTNRRTFEIIRLFEVHFHEVTVTTQNQRIYGKAGSRARIQVVDRQSNVIAETTADASGEWSIEASVVIGSSVRADVTENGGRRTTSDWLEIVGQHAAEPTAPEETAEEREHRELQEAETAEIRERLEAYYTEVVCNLADGYDCDFEAVGDLLTALGRSIDAFEADVTAMQRATYGARTH